MADPPPALSGLEPEIRRRSLGARTLKADRKFLRGVALAALVTLGAGPAAAQGASAPREEVKTSLVVLRTPSCAQPSASLDRFVQLLAIELAIGRVQLVRDVPTPGAELTIEMDGAVCALLAHAVSLSLVRPSGVRASHTVDLHDVDEGARPRALALAVAELVRAVREAGGAAGKPSHGADVTRNQLEPATAGQPAEKAAREPAAPATATEATAPTPRPETPWSGDAEGCFASRVFTPEGTIFLGANLAAALRLRPAWLSVRADLAASGASIDDPLGSIALSIYSAGLSLRATAGRFPELSVGPHLEVGLARATGSASGSGAVGIVDAETIALVSLAIGAKFWVDRFAPSIELDVGTAIASADVYADDRRVAAVNGAFLGLRAGVALGY